MTIIERIKKLSKQKGFSLQKTAELAGIGINSIYRWDKKTPSTSSLQAVADVLGVTTSYLLGENSTPIPEKLDLKDALDDEIILAFDGHDIPDEDKAKIKEYIQLLDLKRRSEHE